MHLSSRSLVDGELVFDEFLTETQPLNHINDKNEDLLRKILVEDWSGFFWIHLFWRGMKIKILNVHLVRC